MNGLNGPTTKRPRYQRENSSDTVRLSHSSRPGPSEPHLDYCRVEHVYLYFVEHFLKYADTIAAAGLGGGGFVREICARTEIGQQIFSTLNSSEPGRCSIQRWWSLGGCSVIGRWRGGRRRGRRGRGRRSGWSTSDGGRSGAGSGCRGQSRRR